MKIPRYIVIKLEMIGKDTVKATEITDRCEIYEYEADEDEQIASKFTDVGNSMVSAVESTMSQLKGKLKDEPSNSEKPNSCKDKPQTGTEIAKAIVHKMIDDSVIAEDAYPDLRQKMHDAVDEYEPQTERSE